jgi:hypothetical protein
MKESLELRASWLSSDGRPAYRIASDTETSYNANSPFARPLSEGRITPFSRDSTVADL